MDSQPEHSISQAQPHQLPQAPPPQNYPSPNPEHSLNEEDFGSIAPSGWLTDNLVDVFLKQICHTAPGHRASLSSTTLEILRFLLMSELAPATEAEPAPSEAEIEEAYRPLRIQAATVAGSRGLVFMPFCWRGHWYLAVADLQHRIIRVYDSMVSDACYRDGRVKPHMFTVAVIVPIAKRILSFCVHEDHWAVEHMWLPVQRNSTECGVYICMMALQHCYQPRFCDHDYVTSFRGADGQYLRYKLDGCYWLAARRIILQVCRGSSGSPQISAQTTQWESEIMALFWECFDDCPVQQQIPGHFTYRGALLATLWSVTLALDGIVQAAAIGAPGYVEDYETILRNTHAGVLTPDGIPFRDAIIREAMDNINHNTEARAGLALQKAMESLRSDIRRAELRPPRPLQLGVPRVLTRNSSASTLQEEPTGQTPMILDVAPSSSCDAEEANPES